MFSLPTEDLNEAAFLNEKMDLEGESSAVYWEKRLPAFFQRHPPHPPEAPGTWAWGAVSRLGGSERHRLMAPLELSLPVETVCSKGEDVRSQVPFLPVPHRRCSQKRNGRRSLNTGMVACPDWENCFMTTDSCIQGELAGHALQEGLAFPRSFSSFPGVGTLRRPSQWSRLALGRHPPVRLNPQQVPAGGQASAATGQRSDFIYHSSWTVLWTVMASAGL